MTPYIVIENPDGSPRAMHHESWGRQWVSFRPNGEIDIHERKLERDEKAAQIRIPRA